MIRIKIAHIPFPPKEKEINGKLYIEREPLITYIERFKTNVINLELDPTQWFDIYRKGIILEDFVLDNSDNVTQDIDEYGDAWLCLKKDIFTIYIRPLKNTDKEELELAKLRRKVKEQAYQIGLKDRALNEKNIALDAMHYVWCSGHCDSGVHRYDGQGKKAITPEILIKAIDNTKRLVDKCGNKELLVKLKEIFQL